ncbi:MAG: class F sortase [Candidatus Paceibacterota bacterium]
MSAFLSRQIFLVLLLVLVSATLSLVIFRGSVSRIPGALFDVPILESLTISTTEAIFKHPVRLKIPKIGVDAEIESVGLTPQGSVGVPERPSNAAWFDGSPHPGEIGNAIIVGHFGWKDGVSSVFDDLSRLKKGDLLYVEDDTGMTVTFVVRESRRYDPKADASVVFNSSDEEAHLNLITCEGVWSEAEESYSLRLVVFADRVYEAPGTI